MPFIFDKPRASIGKSGVTLVGPTFHFSRPIKDWSFETTFYFDDPSMPWQFIWSFHSDIPQSLAANVSYGRVLEFPDRNIKANKHYYSVYQSYYDMNTLALFTDIALRMKRFDWINPNISVKPNNYVFNTQNRNTLALFDGSILRVTRFVDNLPVIQRANQSIYNQQPNLVALGIPV